MKKPVLCMGAPSALVELFRMVLKEVSLELEVRLPGNYIKPGTYAFVIIDTRSARGWRAALKALVEQKEKVVLIFGRTQPRTEVMDNALRQGAAAVIGAKYKKNEDPAALIRAVLQNAEVLPRREHCPLIAKFSATVFGGTATVHLIARVVSPPGVKHTVAQALREDAPMMVLITVFGTIPRYPQGDVALSAEVPTSWFPADTTGLNWCLQLMVKDDSGPVDAYDARVLFMALVTESLKIAWDTRIEDITLEIRDFWIHPGVGEQEN